MAKFDEQIQIGDETFHAKATGLEVKDCKPYATIEFNKVVCGNCQSARTDPNLPSDRVVCREGYNIRKVDEPPLPNAACWRKREKITYKPTEVTHSERP